MYCKLKQPELKRNEKKNRVAVYSHLDLKMLNPQFPHV